MSAQSDVDGARQLESALRTASTALRDEFREGMRDSAGEVVRAAKSHVPILSGKARDSIMVEVDNDGARIVAGGRKAPYFHILEFGSKIVRGGHYLGNALEAARGDIEAAALEAVKDAARRGGLNVG